MLKHEYVLSLHCVYLFLLLLCIPAHANDPKFVLEPVYFDSGINIDGYLNEEVWKSAAQIRNFYTYQPVDGHPAEDHTAALIGYDRNNLYIALICFDREPEKIRATLSKRDDIFTDDLILLYIDTFNEGKTAYQFAFNPYGIQADGLLTEYTSEDFNPDFILYSKGRMIKNGYIIEAKIPFKSLRFPEKDIMDWKIGILRIIQHSGQVLVWPAISLDSPMFIGQFGTLKNISHIKGGSRLEILPEIAAIQEGSIEENEFEDHPAQVEAGLNIRYGLASDLSLGLTVNPDFSQVEADANKIDVNRRFPLRYNEKRPFFLEGVDLFQTPIEAVYTRQLLDPLCGAKITGRMGDYSIGFLSEADQYEGSADFLNSLDNDPALNNKYRDKYTFNHILRVKRNLSQRSFIGLLITDREFSDTYNRVYGADGQFAFSENYVLTFQGLFSQSMPVIGSGYIEDPAFFASLYRGSRNFNFQLYYNDIYPDFVAANGFIERTDVREAGLQMWYDFLWHDHFLQKVTPSFYYSQIFDHENNLIENSIAPSVSVDIRAQTSLKFQYYYQMEEYFLKEFPKDHYSVTLDNKSLSWLHANLYAGAGDEIYYYGTPAFLGKSIYITADFTLKPARNISNEISFKTYQFDGTQNNMDLYLRQNIYRLRSNWQITRDLSLRLIIENVDIKQSNTVYSESNTIDFNLLFSYNPSPGTVFFLGYNDQQYHNDHYKGGWFLKDYQRFERGLFTKFSYLFRL